MTLPSPQIKTISLEKVAQISQALGILASDVQLAEQVDIGAVWYTLQLTNAKQVLNINPKMGLLSQAIPRGVTGVTIFGKYPANSKTNIEVRSFAPNEGANEDPVCGSGNGCVAAMIKEHHLLKTPQYLVSQGVRLGRDGYVKVRFSEDQILLGGFAKVCIEGHLSI